MTGFLAVRPPVLPILPAMPTLPGAPGMLRVRHLPPLVAVLTAGCWPSPALHPPPPAPPLLPCLPRVLAVPDISGIPDELAPPPPPAGDYLHLAAEQCRALACEHAPGARMVQDAALADDRGYLFDDGAKAESARLRRVLARRLAQEVRNRSAGAALDLYYRLLEAELLSDLLAAGVTELDELVRTAEGFRERGFADGAELARLRKQQADARTELLRVRQGARRLSAELKPLVGLGASPGSLLPTDRVTVVRDRLDPEAAVQLAFAHRADLIGLRELDARLGPRTVEAVRQAVVGLVPAVQPVTAAAYSAPPLLAQLLCDAGTKDAAAYRTLLRQALAQREADAAKEVRTAVDEWATQQDLVAVAKRRAAAERQRLAELTARRASGAAVEADYHAARLEALRADAELVREAVKWKRADVAARQAMGLLCAGGEGCQ